MKQKGHHLICYYPPKKEISTHVDIVCMHVTRGGTGGGAGPPTLTLDDRHRDGKIFNLVDPLISLSSPGSAGRGQTVILRISRLYCTNDLGCNIECFIDLDIIIPHPDPNHHHPDNTGMVRFIIPANANGTVPKRDQLLYEPNFLNAEIDYLAYAGMENAILGERSFAVETLAPPAAGQEFQLYRRSDPIIVFMMQNMKFFPEIDTKRDIALVSDNPALIFVAKRATKLVAGFFQAAIFKLLRYKTSNECHLSWTPINIATIAPDMAENLMTPAELAHSQRRNQGFATVVLQLVIEYLVITPDAPPRFESEIVKF